MRYTNADLLEHLASSYVLGTLSSGARRRFARLTADRFDVRTRVAHWEQRLGQLAQSVPQQSPASQVWTAISARTLPESAQPVAGAAAVGGSGLVRWFKPAGWGLGGVAAGALASTLLFIAVPTLFISSDQIAMRSGERLPQSYVGVLSDAQGNGKLLVSSLRQGKVMTIKVIGPIAVPASGRLVLWALPANAPAMALGTVPTTGTSVSTLPDTSEKLLSKVSKLVVTLETDAAPSQPSTTVVFSGNCAKLW